MVKICLTICSHVSYGGPGTIDDRCIGINYDVSWTLANPNPDPKADPVTNPNRNLSPNPNPRSLMYTLIRSMAGRGIATYSARVLRSTSTRRRAHKA